MTEAEWLACTNPAPMLSFLNERDASARKFRLFSAACARRLWSLLSGDHARNIVEDAERFADGLLSEGQRRERAEKFRATFPRRMTPDFPVPPSYLADLVAYYTLWSNRVSDPPPTLHLNEHGASSVSHWVAFTLVYRETGDWQASDAPNHPTRLAEADIHCRLIRDLFGNPFRPPPLVTPGVLAWNDGTVRRIAQGIYDDRAFDRLPVLADALQDAGCNCEDLVQHGRSAGPHTRGCFLLDLLLGKA